MCIFNQPRSTEFRQTTTLTPEQFIAALTDFGSGRPDLFSKGVDIEVHYVGPTEADVTERSGSVWERLYYDWSLPECVIVTTVESNVWACGSGHTYTFTRQPNGTNDIDVAVVREGLNLRGSVLGFLLRTFARHVLKRRFENFVRAIESWTTDKYDRNHELKSLVMNYADGSR
jgi:hypothetical protein